MGLESALAAGVVQTLRINYKPGNILLATGGTVKLADFGLALEFETSRSVSTDGLLGTLDYLSPEQALGREVDARSDLYSFGVVLYEMLTGRVPHQGQTAIGAVVARLQGKPPDPRALRTEAPAWLSLLVQRLLEREPGARHATAQAVLQDLESKTSRRKPQIRRWLAGAALVAVAGFLWWAAPRPRFAQIVVNNEDGALDKDGNVLWRRSDIQPESYARVDMGSGRLPRIAAILGIAHLHYSPQIRQWLSFLDPETGNIERRVRLPSAANRFPGLADDYGAFVSALDVDGDGADEILVTYVQNPLWPSYTVLYEPKLDKSRVVFLGSGHHNVVGAADVDGDGRKELILRGTSNRLGFYTGFAAVRIAPSSSDERLMNAPAGSPDGSYSGPAREDGLAWYVLLPPSAHFSGTRIDTARREIDFRDAEGGRVRLDFDGFLKDRVSSLTSSERNRLRDEAYRMLRDARRFLSVESAGEASTRLDAALASASAAGDPYLSEWIARVKGTAMIAAGRSDEAERYFRNLKAGSSIAPQLAFDAARAFHLCGQLDRAASWYRAALRDGTDFMVTQSTPNDYLEGLVLCLGELGRWDEAGEDIRRFGGVLPPLAFQCRMYEEYVRWRTGGRPSPERIRFAEAGPGATALQTYWWLEFRVATGERPSVKASRPFSTRPT